MFHTWLAIVFSYPAGMQLLGIVGRSVVIYLAVVFGMRLLGTRPLGRLSAHDFVLVIVISNAVQNALVGGDNTLAGGLVSAATLLVMNQIFTWLTQRYPQIEKSLIGEPVVLIDDGTAQPDAMQRQGITHDELMAALRGHGMEKIEEVRLAILETDGSISVVPSGSGTQHRGHPRFKGPGEKD
jgi:uncharacterized membrane protein YcaP (DUF421 family)